MSHSAILKLFKQTFSHRWSLEGPAQLLLPFTSKLPFYTSPLISQSPVSLWLSRRPPMVKYV